MSMFVCKERVVVYVLASVVGADLTIVLLLFCCPCRQLHFSSFAFHTSWLICFFSARLSGCEHSNFETGAVDSDWQESRRSQGAVCAIFLSDHIVTRAQIPCIIVFVNA